MAVKHSGRVPTAMEIFQYLITGMALPSKNQPWEKVDELNWGWGISSQTPKILNRNDHRPSDDHVEYSFALLMDSMCAMEQLTWITSSAMDWFYTLLLQYKFHLPADITIEP